MDEHRRSVGRRAAQIRDGLGLSQEELAAKAGLSVKTISRFENGRHEGRRDTTRKIADALGVEPNDLLGRLPAPLALDVPAVAAMEGGGELARVEAKLDLIGRAMATVLRERENDPEARALVEELESAYDELDEDGGS